MSTFTMGGETYQYLEPRLWNERDIEIPWAARILANATGRVLEVGNATQEVISHPPRTIVDRWDIMGGRLPVHRADIVDWYGDLYDLILSISTLEHVGTDVQEEQDEQKAIAALDRCVGLLAPGGELAFTIPCGYHPTLQAHVLGFKWGNANTHAMSVMNRDGQFSTEWRELPFSRTDCEFPTWHPPSAKRVLFVRYRKT